MKLWLLYEMNTKAIKQKSSVTFLIVTELYGDIFNKPFQRHDNT